MPEFDEAKGGLAVREIPLVEWENSPWGDLTDEFNEDAKFAIDQGFIRVHYNDSRGVDKIVVTVLGEEELKRRAQRDVGLHKELVSVLNEGYANAAKNAEAKKENGNGQYKEKSPTRLLGNVEALKGRYIQTKDGLTIFKTEKRDEVERFFGGSNKEIMSILLPYLHIKYNYKP
jgi:hypothetical protein